MNDDVKGFIQELEDQRNTALNRAARFAGEAAKWKGKYDELRRELNDRDNQRVEW